MSLELTFERQIDAPPAEVFDAWLNPKTPGTPWHEHDKLILDVKVDGLFCWSIRGIAHYGRFVELERGRKIQLTWVSPNTLGQESLLTLTFVEKGGGTLLRLTHSNLPEVEVARKHEQGWNYFLDRFFK